MEHPSGRRKRLAARDWLLNARTEMRWSRSASTNRQDLIVYPTKCTWGCCTCLCLFWRICSTTGWSHCWRKVADMFGRFRRLQAHTSFAYRFCDLSLAIWLDLSRTTLWREDRSKTTCIGARGPRGDRWRHRSRADQFRTLQGLQ